ncbi:MAG: MFS transporter [Eubacteriaceae bacterium]|jgi:MFS family permease|nr:MFS transporter [Eubacteriaceae bacterium]
MKKTTKILFLITLFLTNVCVMADLVIVPAIADLYEAFPNAVNVVNYIISGPALVMIFSSLLCGKAMKFFSKKTLLVASFALFTGASIFGAFVVNIYYIAFMRTLVGLSMGFVNVLAISIIAEEYDDEGARSTILGIFNAAMAGIGAIIGFIAGFFATESWQAVFKVYWIALPILALILFFIPKTPAERETAEAEDGGTKQTFGQEFWVMCLFFFLFNVLYMVIFYQVSVYVAENGIGNQAFAGLLSSLGTVGSALACTAFGFTYKKLKKAAVLPSYLLLGTMYFLLYLSPGIVTGVIACTLLGAAYGNGFSYYFMEGTIVVPDSKVSEAIGIVTAVNGVGMFLSTYVTTWLQKLLNLQTVTGIMPIVAVVSLVCGVGTFLVSKKYKVSV